MTLIRVTLLFVLTACAEIVGCYLSYLWLRENKSAWLLIPAANRPQRDSRLSTRGNLSSLTLIAWLLHSANDSAR